MDSPNITEKVTLKDLPRDFKNKDKKVIVFTCNWNAYSGLESAGFAQLSYSPAILPLKVMCLGQLSPGILLKAFEKGADGVLLLGCPPGECYFESGNRHAEEVLRETKELIALLGYGEERLMLGWVGAGQGEVFVEKVEQFIADLSGNQNK